jgi:endonuclease/exonuclease/phosphatase family metal-dependent hydrolase
VAKFTQPRPDDVLRVLTLNTWYVPPLEDRTREMVAWIDAVNPHVVCLQEVRQTEDGRSLADSLAEECIGEWSVAYGGSIDSDGLLAGTAVMSRWSVEASEMYVLECVDRRPKSMLYVRTGGFDVYSVHLTVNPKGAAVRESQVLFIDDIISSRSVERSLVPPILAGDFNSPPQSSAIRFLCGDLSLSGRGAYFQDAWAISGDGPGVTWDHRNPHTTSAYLADGRIDYIFVGMPKVPADGAENPEIRSGQVLGAYMACDVALTGTYASDHFGLVADICCPDLTI